MTHRLVLATRNDHKVREMARLLGETVELRPLADDVELPPETGSTYAENALIKARAAARATGIPAIADDSGIEAAAIQNRPGVHSARFAGPDATDRQNLDKLRDQVPSGTRLRYVCVIAYVDDRQELLFEGTCEGSLSSQERGERGFGYDPIFIPDGDSRTMAELTDTEKDSISHRGNAARRLLEWLG
jgi:XTP/dITP diphosphohydrolase